MFNQVIPTSVSSFRIYRETLSRFRAPLQLLSEAEEFQRLLSLYPTKGAILKSLHKDALEQLTELKGKINALTKVTAMEVMN